MREELQEVERWFVRRGVPHFIAGYNAREDVLTRAAPVLVVAFLFSSISAIDVGWPWWGITLATIGGLGLLLAGWAVLNRLRGRRPLALPTDIGSVELAVFVLLPAFLPLIFGGDLSGFVVTIAAQLFVLTVVYFAASYGFVAVSLWAVRQAARSLAQTVHLFTRGLPLLLLGFMFLFLNAEAWQSAGRLDATSLGAVTGLFVVLAAVFLVTQVPKELTGITTFAGTQDLAALVAGTPAASMPHDGDIDSPELTRREWGNLGLVVLVSQGLRIALVSVLVGAFFVALGLLIVPPDTVALWIDRDPTVVWGPVTWFGQTIQLSRELVSVAVFLAGFAGLYFSVYTTMDAALRSEFFDDTIADLRQTTAVRAIYRSVA